MEIVYSSEWGFAYMEPIANLTIDEARQKHYENQKYCATFKDDNRYYCLIIFTGTSVLVSFIDDKQRVYMDYNFRIIETGRLFMSSATFREFEGRTKKVKSAEHFLFKEDGSTIINRGTYVPEEKHEQAHTVVDTSDMYEDYTEFGKYEKLLRKERNITNLKK